MASRSFVIIIGVISGSSEYDLFCDRVRESRILAFPSLAKLDERYKFHTLRHTTASWLTMKGVSPAIIQQILGHADISTTMIYAHLAPETMKNAMEMAFE